MNYSKYIKAMMFSAAVLFTAVGTTSCQDDVVLKDGVDESKFDGVNHSYAFVQVAEDSRSYHVTDLTAKPIVKNLHVGLTKTAQQAVDVNLKFDGAMGEIYNREHSTEYPLLPSALATFENGGNVVVAPGDMLSDPIRLTIGTDNTLVIGTTYLLPVGITTSTKDIKLNSTYYMILVKYVGDIPTADKGNGLKIFSCMEINDTNPLNNLPFTLKKSGKPLVDVVILFSGNINYNSETGRVFVSNNENISAVLHNREKYLKPLQDKGMKIVLGILGNGDMSGVANLAAHTAIEFAQELKAVCDAYKLDGVFFDDEYSKYELAGGNPAFDGASSNNAARLCYETKRAMPDKLCITYIYGRTRVFSSQVYGVNPSEFVDYALADYLASASKSSYLGMTDNTKLTPYSQEYNREYFVYGDSQLQEIVDNKYGGHMIFAMDPTRSNVSRQISSMQRIARVLYNDELVDSGERYAKDW